MKEIIYSKYANDRNDAYKIRTDIVQDENGKRFARKTPLTEKCNGHINAMYQNYLKLSEIFQNTKIRMNHCEPVGNALEFEFVEGETYEDFLDGLLEAGETDRFLEAVKEYVETIRSAATEKFEKTEAFTQMFGDTPDFSGTNCMAVSDVDMIFPNLIIHDGIWEVIDYEWSYAVPIPVDFILYRSFRYYDLGQRHGRLKEVCDLYRTFGMDKEQVRIFGEMEDHFQEFLATGNTPLWKLYQSMQKPLHFPIGMIAENQAEFYRRQIHIVKNYGGAQENADYYLSPVPDAGGHLCFDVPVDEKMQVLVVYPALRSCVVTVHLVQAMGSSTYMAEYMYNGFSADNRTIYYTTDAPYLMFPTFAAGIHTVHFELTVSYPDKGALIDSSKVIDEWHRVKAELEQKKNECEKLAQSAQVQTASQADAQEMEQLRGQVQSLLNENGEIRANLSAVTGSLSWKITRPIRWIKKVFHK